MRLAVWSGPRNLSTAMMYSFGARGDFTVMDEPFYAAFLKATGLDHPMAEEIMRTHESDPRAVAQLCQQDGTPHLYMKHMPHHMLPDFPLDWTAGCVHVHLIRHPARVIASYAAKREAPTLEDIGFAQQDALFERLGGIVIDSTDIRAQPEMMLQRLCGAVGVPWDPAMLHWTVGGHPQDGVWAKHWYGAVHASTGFAGAEGALPKLDAAQATLCEQALPFYERLWKMRI
ncbi:HAD family hydrolase [Sulfitobacter sp. JB4-11]|uniref:sulfotransferase-like domain-containing protein n=1 Tax=Sulfitobacter rhodophyticola TaxID=3238304 RepID=UPI003512D040